MNVETLLIKNNLKKSINNTYKCMQYHLKILGANKTNKQLYGKGYIPSIKASL